MKYGSHAWLEAQYQSTQYDPWGLEWRPTQHYRYRKMLEMLLGHATFSESVAAIDIGCATGLFTEQLAHKVGTPNVIGIDISETAVERARALRPTIRFECYSFERAAYQHKAGADVVTCLETLYYLPPEERAAAAFQIAQIVRVGGLLLISSMSGKKPYLDGMELERLISPYFEVIETGKLCLYPLIWWERIKGRMPSLFPFLARRGQVQADERTLARIGTLDTIFAKLPGHFALSHTYLVARRK